ncbi:MAG: glycosyltransferase family 4 protein [Thermodesulfobacteriota bacterium]
MDSIVTPSGFASIAFKKAGVYRPIYVIPHGVDTEFYRPVSDKKPLTGGRSFNFLAISTHLQRKNIRPLVKAFLEEFREKEDVSLFLLLRPEFGKTQNNVSLEFEEWEERYFRNSAPIFLGTGYVTRDTLRDFYANANAYVMPSNEGFGLTLLEAMASGTPVIALNYGGVLDFINQENGYLVPTGRSFIANDMLEYTGDRFYEPEITKLRATMRHTFENRKETFEKGKQARMYCEKHYTWDRTALEISKIIETTYNQSIKQRSRIPENSNGKQKNTPLSWVLCVLDDISVSKSIKYLRSIKAADSDVLCLFTRYSHFEDVMLARKNGFLFHQWDGTYTNCQANIKSIILTPWVGILYPDEEIEGQLQNLIKFLEAQPKEVYEVLVQCNNGNYEPRFIRSTKLTATPEKVIFKDIRIQ